LVNPGFVKTGAELGITEMLLSGTTTFCDMYFFEDIIAETAWRLGIRAVLGETLLDFPSPSYRTPEEALVYTQWLLDKWKGNPRITVAVAPHSIYTCSADLLIKAKKVAERNNSLLLLHLSETQKELDDSLAAHGSSPPAYLERIGFLAGSKVLAAHCVYLSADDMMLLGRYGVGISHNPQSNLKLGSGIARLPDLLKFGLITAIGTDGAASNNDLDMIDETRTVGLLHKGFNKDSTVVSANQALRMATIGGAKTLGLDTLIGSLEVGKKADLVIFDTSQPHLVPQYNPVSIIIYSSKGGDVHTVIVDGKIVVDNGKITTIDIDATIRNVKSISRDVQKAVLSADNSYKIQ